MTAEVMDRPAQLANLERVACALPHLDRLVLQLRWADGLTRGETALVLDVEAASVLAAEMRLRRWSAAAVPIS
ncbi:MAG: hypothetical protein FJ292_04905 [Planctomycetes bacterium]|nr:hypothetical protein [Planctomycetota bacterium]